jgi:DNA-binding beta-propeller fold protein YncE
LHLTPDGRFGFTPERDQDTVSKIDLATRQVVQTVAFPTGSKPYMLRVTPDGQHVWVQTVTAHTNVVLDVERMTTVQTTPTGHGPVQSAFGPPGSRYGLVTHADDTFVLVLDQATGRAVTRIDVGKPQANASFTPDGGTVFVTVTGGDEVVAIDLTQAAIISRLPTGGQPMGLVLLDLTAP